ncbi:hypothetical protein BU16DRAFT_534561 [Lophium mytilinum]|uniref:MYND-type domain-containing protein n=1 Tax=Lophium mytilinum TaxID=390894 RepID=A0A6A6R5A1_9PEZI|nr:hypothetical protein BU16DRAFT_534561 [Lophium mytilinum]
MRNLLAIYYKYKIFLHCAEARRVLDQLPKEEQLAATSILTDAQNPSHPQHGAWQEFVQAGYWDALREESLLIKLDVSKDDPGFRALFDKAVAAGHVSESDVEAFCKRVNDNPNASLKLRIDKNTGEVWYNQKIDIYATDTAVKFFNKHKNEEAEKQFNSLAPEDQRLFTQLSIDRNKNKEDPKHQAFGEEFLADPRIAAWCTQRIANTVGMPITDLGTGKLVIGYPSNDADENASKSWEPQKELAEETCRSINANPNATFKIELVGDKVEFHHKSWDPVTNPGPKRKELHEAPPGWQPKTYEPRRCPTCHRTRLDAHCDFLECTGCFNEEYCSVNCAMVDWSRHKGDCRKRCGGCGKAGEVQSCAACVVTKYCSRDCQKADWKRHRAECNRMKNGGSQT